ncbi:MAG: hypothetical protein V1853_04810 [bacterium]
MPISQGAKTRKPTLTVADRNVLEGKGLTVEQVALALSKAVGQTGRRSKKLFMITEGMDWDRGHCPHCDYQPGDRKFTIKLTKNRKQVEVTEAFMHLLKEHGVFGQKNAPIRVEPEDLINVVCWRPENHQPTRPKDSVREQTRVRPFSPR